MNVRISQAVFDFFDGVVEVDFWVSYADISDALRVHEDYMLFAIDEQP